jgi:NTE family protein
MADDAPHPRLAGVREQQDRALAALVNVPDIDLYAIDVSFAALEDEAEREYLNDLPTSFVLPADAVDRLRAAAQTIMLASPEFAAC